MKIYNILPILLAIIIGTLIGKYIIDGYKFKSEVVTVFNEEETYYVIQQGVYSSVQSMKENTSKLTYDIYTLEDGLYYAYLAITKNKNNGQKLMNYFKELGYEVYLKEIKFENKEFSNAINAYDEMLKKTEDKNAIKTIYLQVLTKYNELVANDEY